MPDREPTPVYIVDPPPDNRLSLATVGWLALAVAIAAVILYAAAGGRFGSVTPTRSAGGLERPSATIDSGPVESAAAAAEASFQAVVDARSDECSSIADPAAADACSADVDRLSVELDQLVACLESAATVDDVRSCQRAASVKP